MKINIGMRYVKTGIAVVLAILLSEIIQSEYPFFAAIAAVISMESTLANSWIVGRNRVMGTVVGAGVGLGFATLLPNNVFLTGIGVVIIIYICNTMGWKNTISIATIVFIAIMINYSDRNPALYTAYRLFDTLIGISVALAVNALVMPYDYSNQVHEGIRRLNQMVFPLIELSLCNRKALDLAVFDEILTELHSNYEFYKTEFDFLKKEGFAKQAEKAIYALEYIYDDLKMIKRIQGDVGLSEETFEKLKSWQIQLPACGTYVESVDNICYNYHLQNILFILEDTDISMET